MDFIREKPARPRLGQEFVGYVISTHQETEKRAKDVFAFLDKMIYEWGFWAGGIQSFYSFLKTHLYEDEEDLERLLSEIYKELHLFCPHKSCLGTKTVREHIFFGFWGFANAGAWEPTGSKDYGNCVRAEERDMKEGEALPIVLVKL